MEQPKLGKGIWVLVPDYTGHVSHTPPSFGTRCILILDISISSYSTNLFSDTFLYFILQVKTAAGDKPGGATPAPNGQ